MPMPTRKISLDPSADHGSIAELTDEDEPGIGIPLIDQPPDTNSSQKSLEQSQFQGAKVEIRSIVDRFADKRRRSSIRPFSGAYVQLHVLSTFDEAKYWKRLARWVKYEEQEVEGAERLGNPRIPTLSFQSLTSLRRLLKQGVILLGLDEVDLPGIWLRVSEHLRKHRVGSESVELFQGVDTTPELFLLEHRRGYGENRRSSISAFRNRVQSGSEGNLQNVFVDSIGTKEKRDSPRRNSALPRLGVSSEFRKKSTSLVSAVIPEDGGGGRGRLLSSSRRDSVSLSKLLIGTEATIVLVGRDESLRVPTIAFVRLAKAVTLPDVTEVDVPVRFVVILLGPSFNSELEYKEVGRSIATLMSNPSFHNLALNARAPDAILRGINGFLAESIVLPPGDWDPALFPFEELKEAKKVIQQRRKSTVSLGRGNVFTILEEEGSPSEFSESGSSLKRTNRLFGGLTLDLKRRYRSYWSDFKDGLNLQCLATIAFVYFGHVTGNIAFGGLMGQKTDNYIGIAETLVGAGAAGVTFALFSAQPLLLIGTTPPLIMFDESLYKLCISYDMPPTEFLAMRTWVGLWMAIIAFLMVTFEGSCLIKFFTRFTQEIFLTLISALFIVESLSNLFRVFQRHPLTSTYGSCDADGTIPMPAETDSRPNVALLSCILMLGTYQIAMSIKKFRNSDYFPAKLRDGIGNFAVVIAIAVMSGIDFYFKDTETRKLSLPDASQGLKTTLDNRTWIIYPNDESNGEFQRPFGYWIIILAALPALLLFILVFMESSISELMVTRKEMHLRKWDGLHLNILLICIVNTGMGYIGSAWVAAPTIRSVTHASSLAIFSINNPPGEKPKILGVHEQRITSLVISILVGISVFMSDLLKLVPMAVLFGVFLYMGVTSLNGVQLVERFALLFKPLERYPEVPYVQQVRRWKMHLYTIIQLICLAGLWGIKESPAALALALLIFLMVPLRFFGLKYWFNSAELNALDGPAPKGLIEDESGLDDSINE